MLRSLHNFEDASFFATEREDVHDVMVGEEARVLEVVERSEHVEGSSVLCQ